MSNLSRWAIAQKQSVGRDALHHVRRGQCRNGLSGQVHERRDLSAIGSEDDETACQRQNRGIVDRTGDPPRIVGNKPAVSGHPNVMSGHLESPHLYLP
jgi:hypothetical protein